MNLTSLFMFGIMLNVDYQSTGCAISRLNMGIVAILNATTDKWCLFFGCNHILGLPLVNDLLVSSLACTALTGMAIFGLCSAGTMSYRVPTPVHQQVGVLMSSFSHT